MIACLAYVFLLLVAIYENSTLQRLAVELFVVITYFCQWWPGLPSNCIVASRIQGGILQGRPVADAGLYRLARHIKPPYPPTERT